MHKAREMAVIGVEEAVHGPSNCSGPPLTGYIAMRLREKLPDNKDSLLCFPLV